MAANWTETPLSFDEQRRFDELVAKRQEEAITPDELRELIGLSDQSEKHDAERLAMLIEMEQLHGMTLPAFMTMLGITARPTI